MVREGEIKGRERERECGCCWLIQRRRRRGLKEIYISGGEK